jgi:hypothetical protein
VTERSQRPLEEKTEYQLTRELELLISAGLIFALLQLPGLLDSWWNARYIHLGGAAFGTVFVIYYVGKLLAYGLVAAIVCHFLLRGLWIAVLGLRSAFPGGVDHERLHFGPLLRSFYRERLLTLEDLEERTDRVAASLFSFVFLFVMGFAMIAIWAAASWGIALLVSNLLGREEVLFPLFLTLVTIFLMLQLTVVLVDRFTRTRKVPAGVQRGALRLMKFIHYASFNFVYAPVFLTFSTRLSRRFIGVTQVIFLYAMIAMFTISVFTSLGVLGFDSYAWFPNDARQFQARPSHYDNLRPAGETVVVPTIQSDVIEDRYIRFFVPYDAREDNPRIRKLCPGVKPVRREGLFMVDRTARTSEARVREIMGCLTRIYQIRLDGRPLPELESLFYVHPQGKVAGRLMMVPAQNLSPGRHLLTVVHTPVGDPEVDERADEYYIPFWR